MNLYDGNNNLLIKKPYKNIIIPIKFLIDFLQSFMSYSFRFMNFSKLDNNFNDFIKKNYIKGSKVLDFGSGFGTFAKYFDNLDYIGIEINNKYILRAQKLNPKYKFLNLNLDQTILDNKYKLVLIYGVLHHIPDNEVKNILINIKNALDEDGKIYIYEPLPPQSLWSIKSLVLKNLDLGNFIRTKKDLVSLIPNDLTYEELSLISKTDHIRLVLKK